MKKVFFILCIAIMSVMCFALAGCSLFCSKSEVEVEKYYLNENDYLVAEYEDGTKEELTTFEEILLNSRFDIKISSDGYYIINGVPTNILARYSVKFSIDEKFGKTIPEQKIIKGEKAYSPEIDVPGYKLIGWYDETGSKWDFNSGVTKALNLTAKLEAKKYDIMFVTARGETPAQTQYTFDAEYVLPDLDGTVVGYDFNGWKCKGEFVSGNKWNIPENSTLVADWSAKKYIIKFDNGGHGDDLEDKEVAYDSEYALRDLHQTGYTFEGWFEDGSSEKAVGGIWKRTENLSLTAKWTANQYTVSFSTIYGTAPEQMMVTFGETYDAPEFTHEQTGYTFNGWNNVNSLVDWSKAWSIANDCTLTANWTANEYTITYATEFDADNADLTDEKYTDVTYDSSFTLPVLTQKGYTFEGWFNGDTKVEEGIWNFTENLTLTAKWTANVYDVTLKVYEGDFEEKTVQVTFDENFEFDVPVSGNRQFVGWFDGTDVDTANKIADHEGKGLTVWNKASNVTLHGHFSDTYILAKANDLQKLSKYPSAKFIVINNIDASSLGQWKPIGTEKTPFAGTIDGRNFTISGLNITALQEGVNTYGLIGYSYNANIENLNLSVNYNIPAIVAQTYVGGLIGYSKSAQVSNVTVNGSIKIAEHATEVSGYAGGVIGWAGVDTVSNCVNKATVSAQTTAGGVIGYKERTQNETSFSGNYNYGTITAWIAGGLIGDSVFGFAYKCKNAGAVNGKYYAGGIIGRSDVLAIAEQCVNTANVTTSSKVVNRYDAAGGIVGFVARDNGYAFAKHSSVTNSYNTGKISGTFNAGGIIGATRYPQQEVRNCYNAGEVSASQHVGGIVGLNEGVTVAQSLNVGKLTATSDSTLCSNITYATEIVYNVYIEHCYYNGEEMSIDNGCVENTDEIYSSKFYKEKMFWDTLPSIYAKIWNFSDSKLPTLAFEA